MSTLQQQANGWENEVRQSLVHAITEERQPWVKGKIFYSLMTSAGRNFLYYIEKPYGRESALDLALVLREMAQGFDHDKQDLDKLVLSVAQKLIPVGEEAAVVERPDWISEEDWAQAQHDAAHDESDNLLRPQLEGFLTGAYYAKPCLYESEFDDDKIRNAVRAAANNVLFKVEADYKYTMRQYQKPNSKKWAGIWMNKLYDAKDDLKIVQDFITKHSLEYDN